MAMVELGLDLRNEALQLKVLTLTQDLRALTHAQAVKEISAIEYAMGQICRLAYPVFLPINRRTSQKKSTSIWSRRKMERRWLDWQQLALSLAITIAPFLRIGRMMWPLRHRFYARLNALPSLRLSA